MKKGIFRQQGPKNRIRKILFQAQSLSHKHPLYQISAFYPSRASRHRGGRTDRLTPNGDCIDALRQLKMTVAKKVHFWSVNLVFVTQKSPNRQNR